MAPPMALTAYDCPSPWAAVVLAHGAGAGQASPFMVRLAKRFSAHGAACATFDFPYMTERRRVPDRPAVLEQAWRDAAAAARAHFGPLPLFIGGKSMGGRIASHVAADRSAGEVAGLILFGYPLHPPGRPQQRRDAHLPQIAEPMLFVQGSRDPFGTGEEIRSLLPSLRRATLHEVPGGDHSLKAPARDRGAIDPIDAAIAAALEWMRALTGTGT